MVRQSAGWRDTLTIFRVARSMLAALRGGMAFVHKQVLVENLMTFFGWTSDPETPSHSFFYVVPAFFTGFAPLSVFTIPRAGAHQLACRSLRHEDAGTRGNLYKD